LGYGGFYAMAKRGMSPEKASEVNLTGHAAEKEFARLIGMDNEYLNGLTDKKDVVDRNGDTHSIKGGETRWQLFLYGADRFKTDTIFKVMGGIGDGVGELILSCLNCYPKTFSEYETNKDACKQKLKPKMLALCGKLQDDNVFAAFLSKSMFNCGEVTYLTIQNDGKFHVFLSDEVVDILTKNIKRECSKARTKDQTHYQKVTFINDGKNVGTIEIRHDSDIHYRQAIFGLDKKPIFNLLSSDDYEEWGGSVVVYGKAISKFKKEHKQFLDNNSVNETSDE
jgi:hypothetical protein